MCQGGGAELQESESAGFFFLSRAPVRQNEMRSLFVRAKLVGADDTKSIEHDGIALSAQQRVNFYGPECGNFHCQFRKSDQDTNNRFGIKLKTLAPQIGP